MFQSQGQWDCRQEPKVHAAFAELWRTERLWTSFDIVAWSPPSRDPSAPFTRGVHFDVSQRMLRLGTTGGMLRLQGEVVLEDCGQGDGGFICAPTAHRHLDAWVRSRPEDEAISAAAMVEDLGLEVVEVPAKAGDLIIWSEYSNGCPKPFLNAVADANVPSDSFLPVRQQRTAPQPFAFSSPLSSLSPLCFLQHGNCRNDGRLPRMMHAVGMYPADLPVECEWKELTPDPYDQAWRPGKDAGRAIAEERRRRLAMWHVPNLLVELAQMRASVRASG